MDHATVGRGPLVGAHAELATQRARQLREEAAAHAGRRDRAAAAATGGLAGAELAVDPPLRGLCAALRGQHAGAAEAELPLRDAVGVLVAGGLVALLEALVLLPEGQQVIGADVLGLEALGPRLPLGGEDRVVAREQRGLGDRGGLRAGGTGDHHHPGPAAIPGHGAVEDMGDEPITGGLGAQVLADLAGFGHLEQRLAGELDGIGGDRVQAGPGGAGATGGGGRLSHLFRPRNCRRRHGARWRSSARARDRDSGPGAGRWRRRPADGSGPRPCPPSRRAWDDARG